MKIASFNVENLFDRAKLFNEDKLISDDITQKVTALTNLIESEVYSDDIKTQIIDILKELGLEKSDESEFVVLRKNRGKFLSRPKNKPVEVSANGRKDWIGWLELKTEPVNETAILNTARVIRDVDADIMVVIEAENRIALKDFNDDILKTNLQGEPYDEVMVIDGNDRRGIDVGIMTKNGYKIGLMRSHVHDKIDEDTFTFSRDCPEYEVTTPENEVIYVLPNHFKSKFGGNDPKSKYKRLKQSEKVKEIYLRLISEGKNYVVILGDLNDTPNSNELEPLFDGTGLKDVSDHPLFDPGEFKEIGTFGLGNNENKIDYILLSPALYSRIKGCGLFRKGAWPGTRPKRWEVYPELEKEVHVASDHHLIWVEIE